MKKLIFILLAGALSYTVSAQSFSDGSTGKRHKSNSKPKKQRKKKKKSKKKESTSFYMFPSNGSSVLCFNYTATKTQTSIRQRKVIIKTEEKV